MRSYRSRIDGWLLALVAGAIGLGLFVLAGVARLEGASIALPGIVLQGAVVALVAWIFLGTRYELGERHLVVRSGPFRWTLPYESLVEVRPSRSPLSSPALSLHRLELRSAAGRSILVSPADREGFLRHLAEAAGLAPDGPERLIRR